MSKNTSQNALFEDDYLLRELGQVAHVPQVALTELVANAWDAGASQVDLKVPTALGGILSIVDDGHGMTPDQFKKRWMTLRYNREKYQGLNVEFPPDRVGRPRRAYGRNGVGRHGLLCFSNEYEVQTWRDGTLGTFIVGTESGPSPFVLRSQSFTQRLSSGTQLSVQVERNLPDADEILTVLAARFVHDPEFAIRVNGKQLYFENIAGKVSEETINLGEGRNATIIVIDSTQSNHSAVHQGVAFWVQRRLVGTPSWSIGSVASFDGRTRFARRYKVIVDTQGYESEVEQDWTAFRPTDAVRALYIATARHIDNIVKKLAGEIVEAASVDALSQNRVELATLGQGARLEVAEFTKTVAEEHPTISPDFLSSAVKAVIHLEQSKRGAALLRRLSKLPLDDIDGLDRLLSEWTVKDALRVLDEIDDRLSVIETLKRLADDPQVDELHTLHPLILRSRWLFGPEFESLEYCSNVTLQTVARELFQKKGAHFNKDNRPDIVVLPDNTTWQITGVEAFDSLNPEIAQIQRILVIELKKGGFKITRNEINQADGYVQDIAMSAARSQQTFIDAWVVGQKIDDKAEREKKIGNPTYGRIRAVTFSQLVDTANARMMRLRTALDARYGKMSNDKLLDKVFSNSTYAQNELPLSK